MPPKKKKLTREEHLQKKREAERLRYQRKKNDPQKREAMREKERLKYQRKKEKGLRKLVKDMTPREHRTALKKWKEHCTVYRSKQKVLKNITNIFMRENTPSSDHDQNTTPPRSLTPVPGSISISPSPGTSSVSLQKRKSAAKKLRRQYNKKKNDEIAELKKRIERYKKRLARFEARNKKTVQDTPNTKILKMLEEPEKRKEVVKKALFGEIVCKQLNENYSNLKHIKDKGIFRKAISGRLVQKYKHWIPKESANIYRNGKKYNLKGLDVPACQRIKIPVRCKQTVQNFFEDDSNSRMAAGKKEYITRQTVKKQKRYLLDTVRNLYNKFVTDNFRLSYQTFCRLRPFWVVKPSAQNRDTCLCVIHSNLDLKLCALYEAKMSYCTYQSLLADMCCDRYNEACLSRECSACINKNPGYKEFNNSRVIKYKMWIAERQEIQDFKTKKPRFVTKYLKKIFDASPKQLIARIHEDLVKFFDHQRNIVHQYNAMNDLKANLQVEDVLIHVDFSENYCTKYADEIQAFHFGGSRVQLSLHTVVVYQNSSIRSFCTVSQNISHSPAAIWAHLRPIFKALPRGIKRLHFLSDGPVTQYRNKTMFFIMATKLAEEMPDVENFTWNFTESGHGKGAPDGVGATCKRTADFVVNSGGDVNNIDQFVKSIQERCPNITCIAIDDYDIQAMIDKVEEEASDQKSFKGTLNVHQVSGVYSKSILGLPTKCKTLIMKSLSCFCDNFSCEHFKIGSINFDIKQRWMVEEVYSESESDELVQSAKTSDIPVAGSSGTQNLCCYKTGDYVLVKFCAKKFDYRYAAVINDVDEEENDLRVTFLKVCNKKVQTFQIDDKDTADVPFDQVICKLDSPDLILQGKRIFYRFPSELDVFER